ncbi:MAG: hypothetical protein JNM78_04600 [Cyclobacteriaceae bacterium]|nr:hypothetical protein [Cyclobacteriaceae bacterium]
MTLSEFKSSLEKQQPPPVAVLLQALWHDGCGNWEKAHNIAQDVPSKDGSWIHAYLHRKEGDQFNAQYWYNRAGRVMPAYSLEKEWAEIVQALLNN